MTNLQALKAKVQYPLTDNAFEIVLQGRGLTSTSDYSATVDRQSFDLAYADAMVALVTAPDVSEGGYSVSQGDKQAIINIANSIYKQYDQVSPVVLKPTATFVRRW